MAFSDFDLRTVVDSFGLREERNADLFAGVAPLEPSEYLRDWLKDFGPLALGVGTELARNVYLIAPLLAEAQRRAKGPVNVLPGMALDADKGRGLNGYCDYIIARSEEIYYLRSPLAAVVEAKREDIIGGLGQCAAAMVGMRVFNERYGTPFPMLHGAVSSGTNWRFLRLEGDQLTIDRPEYYVRDVGVILAILVHIMGGPKPVGATRAA
ncbi:MAG TPA: hypothetical protein VMS17_08910 [Gemmataceae bacterium]|nr:hypothetical protein [Gemmataceae bacterium]